MRDLRCALAAASFVCAGTAACSAEQTSSPPPAQAGVVGRDFETHGEFWYLQIERGVELFVHEIGEGEGPPVVVLPGGPGAGHAYMHEVARGLTNDFRFVFYDPRGTTRSPARGATYTIEDHVSDLEALRRALGAERIRLVSHSAGTTLAYHYLAAFPERVANMVLVGAVQPVNGTPGREIFGDEDFADFETAATDREAFAARPALAEEIRKAGLEEPSTPREFGRLAVLEQFASGAVHVDRWQSHVPLRINPEVARQTQGSIDWDYNRMPLLQAHPFPITVVNGEYDVVVGARGSPVWHRLAEKHLPNVRVVSIANAGHDVWVDEPEEVRRVLGEGLD